MYHESRDPVLKTMTPIDAERFLAINNFPGQRKYDPLKGREYADGLAAGTHRRVEIAVAKVKESGVDYLMNGQHNCNAILLHGKPVRAVVSYYSCESMEDAWRLFATYDVHRPRTSGQFMASRRSIFADVRLHDVPVATLNACGSALYALGGGSTPTFAKTRFAAKTSQADLVERYSDDVVFVSQWGKISHLLRVGVVAAIIGIRRVSTDSLCKEFFDKVATGEMLSKTEPSYKLRETLLTGHHLRNGNNGRDHQKNTYTVCVCWWNSWRDGERRMSVKLAAIKEMPTIKP